MTTAMSILDHNKFSFLYSTAAVPVIFLQTIVNADVVNAYSEEVYSWKNPVNQP